MDTRTRVKVGDFVTIRKDMKEDEDYGTLDLTFCDGMVKHAGKTVKVAWVQNTPESGRNQRFEIEADDRDYTWNTAMISAVKRITPKFAVVWDEERGDPVKTFADLDSAKEFATGLTKKRDVIQDSIQIWQLGKCYNVKVTCTIKAC